MTAPRSKRPPVPTYDPKYVRAVSAAAYRSRFSEYDRERILADPERGEEFFRKHSAAFDSITRSCLDAINEIGLQPRAVRSHGEVQHDSDCAVHNAPALPVGPCDCGAEG